MATQSCPVAAVHDTVAVPTFVAGKKGFPVGMLVLNHKVAYCTIRDMARPPQIKFPNAAPAPQSDLIAGDAVTRTIKAARQSTGTHNQTRDPFLPPQYCSGELDW